MLSLTLQLAQSAHSRQASLSVLFWLGVIVAIGVVGGLVGWFIIHRLKRQMEPGSPQEAFTLADLRRLHREGQLSDDEFERAKAMIIAQTRAALAPKATDDEPAESEDFSADASGDTSGGGGGGGGSDKGDDDDAPDAPR